MAFRRPRTFRARAIQKELPAINTGGTPSQRGVVLRNGNVFPTLIRRTQPLLACALAFTRSTFDRRLPNTLIAAGELLPNRSRCGKPRQ